MDIKQKARIFRERFYGRQDVFGQQWQHADRDGEIKKGYTPLCENHWAPGCHIKLNDGINCSNCEIQKFVAVSDDSVLEHIQGGTPQMHYLLQTDSTIMFGAFDFDQKPGKEAKGHDWKDVLKVIKVMQEWGMPYAIARSTGNGYHIYYFMDEAYPARKFRAIMMEICDRCGFTQENLDGVRNLPERFPKQSYVNGTDLGNGIKPPMIEPNFIKGRNCFVTDENTVIDNQWAYLDSVPRISVRFLDGLIEKFEIPLEKEQTFQPNKRSSGIKTNIMVAGSIEKVLEGCKSLRELKDKMKDGHVPTHFEGMGLYHMAMNTLDGKEWFINNVPGWGKDSSGLRQLEHSEAKGYSPWTCRKMQESGICPVNTKCFEKKPPVEYVEGRAVVKNDVPESQWPDPSPIRYALGKGEDFLRLLMTEIEEISKISDPEKKNSQLSAIVARVSVFDQAQQTVLKNHLETMKVAKKSDLNKLFNQANTDRVEKVRSVESEGSEYFVCGGVQFKYLDPGYAMLRPGKKGQDPALLVLSDCYIDIIEERTVIEEFLIKKKVFFGRFTSNSVNCDFEIDSNDWADNSKFQQFFITLAGIAFKIKKPDIECVRQVIHHTSEHGRPGVAPCKRTQFFSAPGWYSDTYITQSVVIDKDGVRPNTEKPVYIQGKNDHASNIDFKLMSDPELLATVFHLKSDFMHAFPRDHSMLGIGFAMIAAVHSYLDMQYKPTFWLEGTTGNGKTALLLALQHFYGDFKGGVNWTSTGKSISDHAYQFQDSLLLTDDFKAETPQEIKAAKDTIQNSYERSVRSAMTKEGTQRGDRYSRCLFIMSGEEVPGGASHFARMVILNSPPTDKMVTKDAYEQVLEHQHNYKGVTAKFIHWVLNRDKKMITSAMIDYQNKLQSPISSMQNASRVSYNTALCFLGWSLFCDFMRDVGAATDKEIESFKAECWEICEDIRNISIERCQEGQSGVVFLTRLTEMLASGEVGIRHLDGYDREGMKLIGFIDDRDATPNVCYIYPDTAIEAVKKSMATAVVISRASAGTQLGEMGALARRDLKGGPQIVKKDKSQSVRVWCIKLEKLGISKELRVVGGTQMMNLVQPIPNAEGLI